MGYGNREFKDLSENEKKQWKQIYDEAFQECAKNPKKYKDPHISARNIADKKFKIIKIR